MRTELPLGYKRFMSFVPICITGGLEIIRKSKGKMHETPFKTMK